MLPENSEFNRDFLSFLPICAHFKGRHGFSAMRYQTVMEESLFRAEQGFFCAEHRILRLKPGIRLSKVIPTTAPV